MINCDEEVSIGIFVQRLDELGRNKTGGICSGEVNDRRRVECHLKYSWKNISTTQKFP